MNIKKLYLVMMSMTLGMSMLTSAESCPVKGAPVSLPRPGASVEEIKTTLFNLEQEFELAQRVGNTERAAYIKTMIDYVREQIAAAEMKKAEEIEKHNQLLRVSARYSKGEWSTFWKDAERATGVILVTALLIPVVVIAWQALAS